MEAIQREMTIDADAATVFAFFTDPERLIRWIGVTAELEPQVGGIMLVEVIPGRVSRGEFKEVVPVSRLAYTFGWDGSQNGSAGFVPHRSRSHAKEWQHSRALQP